MDHKSFPTVEPHYCRKDATNQCLEENLNVSSLYYSRKNLPMYSPEEYETLVRIAIGEQAIQGD